MTKEFDKEVIRLLGEGRVGFMPSDTIYGLSGIALKREVVERLHELKDRQTHKPYIILISDIKMLNMLSIDQRQAQPALPYWPGGLTLICEAPCSPVWLHLGHKTLAVRIPDQSELLDLIAQTGPIISTSANPEARKPAETVHEALAYFGKTLDFYVDKGNLPGQKHSTIVKQTNGRLEVIRPGAVKLKEG